MRNVVRILPLCMLLLLYGCRKPSDRTSRGRVRTKTENSNRRTAKNGSSGSQPEGGTPNKKEQSKTKLNGAEIFEKYGSAVFVIYTSDGRNASQGSGFFIDNDGLAVSNYHVFKGTTIGNVQIKLLNDDKPYKVTDIICKSNAPTFNESDFIVFKVDCKNTNYIPIAENQPEIGERVYAIGSPLGLENTLASGEVSGKRGENWIQISVPIDHGSSGGALINEYGEVVGITSAGINSQANLNFAWSIDVIKPYLKK